MLAGTPSFAALRAPTRTLGDSRTAATTLHWGSARIANEKLIVLPMTQHAHVIQRSDVEQAAARIVPYVIRTPTIECEPLSHQFGFKLYLKCENLQHAGAFKARGAVNAVMSLSEKCATMGVVTHSSGNHAAALARAATIRAIPAHIVMPHDSAANKIARVRSYGVTPVLCEPNAESRAATAEALRIETGATMVHPYDDCAVMAGQGTVGLEILAQLADVDVIIVPVGGGGLLSGVLTAVKSVRSDVQVIAAEPELADDAARSLMSGKIERPVRYDTIADGLRTPLGEQTFPIIRDLLDDIVLVSEVAIQRATRILAESARLVAEPSGAVTLAAAESVRSRLTGKSVCVIVSGGNLDFGQCKLGGIF